jgi:hypothetical protein
VYKFSYMAQPRSKRSAEDISAAAAAVAEKKKARITHDESGAEALQAWLDALPEPAAAAQAVMQLRLIHGDTEKHVVLSGSTSLWKLNQVNLAPLQAPLTAAMLSVLQGQW